MWRPSAVFAAVWYIFWLIYLSFYLPSWSWTALSPALALTGAVLLGSSFGLSSMSYFFDFLDKELRFRKYLGILGFYCAFAYSVSLLIVEPDRYFFGFFRNFFTADFLLGLSAVAILTMMFVISYNWAIKRLGAKRWRQLLRMGYLAYFFLILRGWLLEQDAWLDWMLSPAGLPPPRLVVSTFATIVILVRFVMLLHQQWAGIREVLRAAAPTEKQPTSPEEIKK
jgi:DMSO/TMAO reductase YedYZ heme-binding membrane subunit